ncbi:MAG: histidine kinase [Mucilaginibacter sp.]
MEEIYQKPTALSFIKRFVVHAVVVWLVVNVFSWLEYNYKVKFNLAYTVNKDGSLISFTDSFINHNIHQPLFLWIVLVAFLAEGNYVFVFRRKRFVWFIASSACLGVLGGAISLLFTKHLAFYSTGAQFIESAIFIKLYVAGYAILYNFFYERYRRIQYYGQKSEAELQLLKAQINPHFFFNTLNNIYGIALSENANKTAGAVELLSDMMRYNMDGMREDFIKLDDELKFVENYLALQQLRVPQTENITIKTSIEYPKIKYKIAPMLLIPLIENAWKYGISMDKPSNINLNICVEKHQFIMIIENTVLPAINAEKGSGLGISNVKQRLQMLYPGLHQLSIKNDGNIFRVKLSIVI